MQKSFFMIEKIPKVPSSGTKSFFTVLRERVRSDLKRFETRVLCLGQNKAQILPPSSIKAMQYTV